MNKMIKTYEENGISYQFDSKKLNMYIGKMKYSSQMVGEKITKEDIKNELAEKLYVSPEAVKNWMYGYNGPSELEQVKLLGDYFTVDYHQLLKMEEEKMTSTATIIEGMANSAQAQYTKDRIREIYHAMLDYIDTARDNFYQRRRLIKEERFDEFREWVVKAKDEEQEIIYEIDNLLRRSLLDIPKEIYDEIDSYVWTVFLDPEPDDGPGEEELSDDELKELENDSYVIAEKYMENYYQSGYLDGLKKLFKDYMVK